jgi:EAL domain-containing protein (putative c-di-GMP-specific phosphodiesterase class I)
VKLDRTLIEGIERDRSQRALAAGLISFAQQIDAEIVAEGIEHPSQLQALRQLGVTYGQGFLLSRPAPLPLAQVATNGSAAATAVARSH